MDRVVVDVRVGAVGFDTDTRLDAAQYRAFRALGMEFAIRYLADLSDEEVDDCLGSGLLLGAVQHAHGPGWHVDSEQGMIDGKRAIVDANAAALPPMPLFCDLEEPAPLTSIDAVNGYAREWCAMVTGAKHEAEVYWGAGMPGDAHGLYGLAFTGYWKSFSNVISPWRRGYKMFQLFHFPKGECQVRQLFPDAPANIADVWIDVDVALHDYLGGRVRMVRGV